MSNWNCHYWSAGDMAVEPWKENRIDLWSGRTSVLDFNNSPKSSMGDVCPNASLYDQLVDRNKGIFP